MAIKKGACNEDIIKDLLDSDWPRIQFNKCWQIQKYLEMPKHNCKVNRIKLVQRAMKAVDDQDETSNFE